MKLKKKFLFFFGTIFILIPFVLIYLSTLKNTDDQNLYSTLSIKKAQPLLFNGLVEPLDIENIFWPIEEGTIENISVENFDLVKSGDLLFEFRPVEVLKQLEEKERILEKAYISLYYSTKKLYATLEIQEEQENQELVDQLSQQLELDQIEVNNLEADIQKLKDNEIKKVYSKIDGMILINYSGVTDLTSPFIRVISQDTKVISSVLNIERSYLDTDKPVILISDENNRKIEGHINFIDILPKEQDTSSGLSEFEFSVLSKEKLELGYKYKIEIPIDEIRIPYDSLIESDGYFVFLYINGKVKKKEVEILTKSDYAVIKKGLAVNDVIILNPNIDLKDGDEVLVN